MNLTEQIVDLLAFSDQHYKNVFDSTSQSRVCFEVMSLQHAKSARMGFTVCTYWYFGSAFIDYLSAKRIEMMELKTSHRPGTS